MHVSMQSSQRLGESAMGVQFICECTAAGRNGYAMPLRIRERGKAAQLSWNPRNQESKIAHPYKFSLALRTSIRETKQHALRQSGGNMRCGRARWEIGSEENAPPRATCVAAERVVTSVQTEMHRRGYYCIRNVPNVIAKGTKLLN